MAKCTRCGKGGLFQRLIDGLCKNCYLETQRNAILDNIPILKKIEKPESVPISSTTPSYFEYTPCIDYQGDYAKAIFLWLHRKPMAICDSEHHPRYLRSECGIEDTIAYHKQLIADGYFIPSTIREKLELLKVPDLKEILRQMNAPVTGVKAVLIDRIIENSDDARLNSLLPMPIYSLSEKGHSFLNEYNHYVLLHKHNLWMISWREFDTAHEPNENFYDTALKILEKRAYTKRNSIYDRNAFLFMYEAALYNQNKHLALINILRTLTFDYSADDLHHTFFESKEEDIKYHAIINDNLLQRFVNISNSYSVSMLDAIYDEHLVTYPCDKALFDEILQAAIQGTLTDNKQRLEDCLAQFYASTLK